MVDIYQYSTTEIIHILGSRVRMYRIRIGLTQKELSERAGISIPTLQAFEGGNNNDMSLTTLLRILRVLGQLDGVNSLLPNIPDSPYNLRDGETPIKRIRHK